MIKSLIGALMVATINAPMPQANNTNVEDQEQIQITNVQDSSLILNSDVGTPAQYEWQSQTKIDFEIQTNNYYLSGTQYAYTYGVPYTYPADTKAIWYDSGHDMSTNTLPHRPFSVTVFSLKNNRSYQTTRIYINFGQNNDLSLTTSKNKTYKVFSSTNNNILDLLNANNWANQDQNFYKYINSFCESNLYTNVIKQETTTSNGFYISNTDFNSLNGLTNNYIVVLTYLTTEDEQAGYSGQYQPSNGAVYRINTDSSLQNIYSITTETTINYDVIDLPNLMFTILTMPFSFVSQAFNLKLFPNTPYYIDVSSLFLAIVATMTFIFIIKLILNRS